MMMIFIYFLGGGSRRKRRNKFEMSFKSQKLRFGVKKNKDPPPFYLVLRNA